MFWTHDELRTYVTGAIEQTAAEGRTELPDDVLMRRALERAALALSINWPALRAQAEALADVDAAGTSNGMTYVVAQDCSPEDCDNLRAFLDPEQTRKVLVSNTLLIVSELDEDHMREAGWIRDPEYRPTG